MPHTIWKAPQVGWCFIVVIVVVLPGGEVDETSQFSYQKLLIEGSKDVSFTNSLFASPTRQPRSSLSGWPLETIAEGLDGEDIVQNEVDGWLHSCNNSAGHGIGETL